MPFPNDEVTPPVTKMYLVMIIFCDSAPVLRPEQNVCVRDTKVTNFSVFAIIVEKMGQCGLVLVGYQWIEFGGGDLLVTTGNYIPVRP